MNSTPRILTYENYTPDLSARLTFPHALQTIDNRSDDEIAGMLRETDVLVSGAFKAVWRGDGNRNVPLLVQVPGAGLDGIDMANLPAQCTVCNVYGHGRGVTEQAFMLMMALHKNLLKLDTALRQGSWSPEYSCIPEMGGRHLLILGLGPIGVELVRWGQFLGMEVSAVTRTPSAERGEKLGLRGVGGFGELGKYLPTADFVVVAIPATSDTVDLIGEKELGQMKPTAFLINVGRARVVNEEALYQALSARQIAGAGLDVWYEYPDTEEEIKLPANFPFQSLDNVIMTPHKPTFETMDYRWGQIAKNIEAFMRGETLPNIVHTT